MKKEIRVRCWIAVDGEKFFGPGPAELLELIGETGSIAKAAKAMGMSYKKAWDLVNSMNDRARKPYVVSRKGGEQGGGAEITKAGKALVTSYKKLNRQLNSVVSKHRSILKLV